MKQQEIIRNYKIYLKRINLNFEAKYIFAALKNSVEVLKNRLKRKLLN